MQPSRSIISSLRAIINIFDISHEDIFSIILFAVLSGVITLVLPVGFNFIVQLISGGAITTSLFIIIFIICLAVASDGILTFMQLNITNSIQRKIFTITSLEIAHRIPKQMEFQNELNPSKSANRFFEIFTLQRGIPRLLIDLSTAFLQAFFGLVLLCFYHPFFVVFSIVVILIVVAVFGMTGQKAMATSDMEFKYKHTIANWLGEIARESNTFKLARRLNFGLLQTDKLICDYLEIKKAHGRILTIQIFNIIGFKTLITGALLVLGSIAVIGNGMNIGQFVAAQVILLIVLASLERLFLNIGTVYDVLSAAKEIKKVFDGEMEADGGVEYQSIIPTGTPLKLDIQSLSFTSPVQNIPILKDFNLSIEWTRSICISGYNHSENSTILKCIMGFTKDYEGSILLNGMNLKALDINTWRENVGYFGNNSGIFRGTIEENICIGNPNIAHERTIEVAKQLGLYEYIASLEHGFHTEIEGDGKQFPKTIRAKILLARSIVHNPRLLLMEDMECFMEDNNFVDILNTLFDSQNPWSILAVTNNPIFAKYCDLIILTRVGEVVTEGNYNFISKTKHFNQLYKLI